jgi:ParB/RepB/Spo0J family partition protein
MTIAKNIAEVKVKEIAVGELRLSADETRKTIDQDALNELAASILKSGVLEALIVRPIDLDCMSGDKVPGPGIAGDAFEIVAGQRRYLAAKIAGLATVPCVVHAMDDEQAGDARVISNEQREDLPPMEQAEAYGKLLERPGATVESVAAALAKSPSYVGRRLKLLDAVEPVRDALKAGAIEVGHALELARLDPEQQQKLLTRLDVGYSYRGQVDVDGCEDDDFELEAEGEDERGVCKFCGCTEDDACRLDGGANCSWTNVEETVCSNPDCLAQFKLERDASDPAEIKWHPARVSVAQLRSEIARTTLKVLSAAPFPLDAAIPPASCVECPKRSGNAVLLFDDCAQDTCTDRDCFDAKVKAWIKAGLEDADKEKRKLVMLSDGYSGIQAAVSKWSVTVIPEQKPAVPCESQEEAIWVNGESAGHRTMICRDIKCKQHGSGSSSRGGSSRSVSPQDDAKAKAERKKLQDKLNAEKKYRAALFAAVAVAPIQTLYASDLNLELCLYAIGRAPGQYNNKVAEALGWPAKILDWNGSKQLRETLQKLAPVERLRAALVAAHSGELAVNEYSLNSKPEDMEKLAALLGLDPKDIRAGSDGKPQPAPAKKPDATPAAEPPKKGSILSSTKKRIADAQKKRWPTPKKATAKPAKKAAAKKPAKKAVKRKAGKAGKADGS